MMSSDVGTLEVVNEIKVEWSIVDFFSLANEENAKYRSPQFTFLGESWYLEIRPNDINQNNEEWIALYLFSKHVSGSASVSFILSLKTANGGIDKNSYLHYVFANSHGMGYPQYMRRKELFEKKGKWVPSGVLTAICCIRKNDQTTAFRTEELLRDFTSLMKDDSDTDVIVKVGQEDFRLHRSVLRVRSPVLAAMFTHEMTEKTTGILDIPDCEADVFRIFVDYLYTGKVDKLAEDRVLPLFKVADKYQVKELAEDCMRHMANTLTVDTFFDAVEVASEQGNKFLMKKAVHLLANEIAEIIRTAEWERLLETNHLLANKLLKKAFNNERK